MDRNKNAPRFVEAEKYSKTILETLGGGNEVLRVIVRDEDTKKPFNDIVLRSIGDDSATTFFEVTQEGQVKVRSNANLASDKETQYTVSNTQRNAMFCNL